MQERGISPLIATILLVGLTVSIITVIVAWSQDIFKTVSESSEESLNQFKLEQTVRMTVESAKITKNQEALTAKSTPQEKTIQQKEELKKETSSQAPEEKTVSVTLTNEADVEIDSFKIIVHYKNKEKDMINIRERGEPRKRKKLEFTIHEKGRGREYIEIIPVINEREIRSGSVKITPQEG